VGLTDESIVIRAWPLELVNGRPQDPSVVASHIEDLREQIDAELFAGFDPGAFPSSTLPALSLAAQAYRFDASAGEAASFALRDALFEEGKDPSQPEVLTGIAERVGLPDLHLRDHQLVIEEWHEGRERGVEGSPHFYCHGMNSFCPSLDISRDGEGRLQLRPNKVRLIEFLDACFREDAAANLDARPSSPA
jgi:hypothetical protein